MYEACDETARAPRGWLRALALAAALSASAGCSQLTGYPNCKDTSVCASPVPEFVLVEFRAGAVSGTTPRPEITETPAYRAVRSKLKAVALRLPDNCVRNAQVAAGQNVATAQLESACGVPLQVLERALSKAGYRVLSWSTLMALEREKGIPVHVAAQQLGADFVIIVNKLLVEDASGGAEVSGSYKYFRSNRSGERGAPVELFDADRSWLKGFIRSKLGNEPTAKGRPVRVATLNATVVLARGGEEPAPTKGNPGPGTTTSPAPSPPPTPGVVAEEGRSGEAIWFFNWKLAHRRHEDLGRRFLFGGLPNDVVRQGKVVRAVKAEERPDQHYWWPVRVESQERTVALPSDRAASEEDFGSREEAADKTEDEILYSEAAEAFMSAFQGNAPTSTAPVPTTATPRK